MRNIILRVDHDLFHKLKHDKVMMEAKLNRTITWEDYVQHLFGLKGGKER